MFPLETVPTRRADVVGRARTLSSSTATRIAVPMSSGLGGSWAHRIAAAGRGVLSGSGVESTGCVACRVASGLVGDAEDRLDGGGPIGPLSEMEVAGAEDEQAPTAITSEAIHKCRAACMI